MYRVEALLSPRLFLAPQRVGKRLYFLSNLSGALSLYAMDWGGSVPEPLLPPDIAFQNPTLMTGWPFYVFPELEKILVMLDRDGDENYQPMLIPIEGGYPEPAFGDRTDGYRVHLMKAYRDRAWVYLNAESRKEPTIEALRADLRTGDVLLMGKSKYGSYVVAVSSDHRKAVLLDGYTHGDSVLYLWQDGADGRRLLLGKPIEERSPGEVVPLNGIEHVAFTEGDGGLLMRTTLFEDTYGLAHATLARPAEIRPVRITGTRHRGAGEIEDFESLGGRRYLVTYNIDGENWAYAGTFEEAAAELRLETVICGEGELAHGVIASHKHHHDEASEGFAFAISTATSPTQIYTVDPGSAASAPAILRHTRERVLSIPHENLSQGEDASFDSHDGLRTSARLYRPAAGLDFQGPRPLVYYVHGGPQSQERPDFAWFSMPLIQHLTLRGFAVFVPNVRGSTGYGLRYAKWVDRDWGGRDRLDHVHALKVLAGDPGLDVRRTGVVGRSYGGYMSLTLAARHPGQWAAAVDMFGPYDLITFSQRIPE
ncbi:MAG: alpha/beta hydrolase family protein, partial [Anaerolineales bacterium]